jgi:hypothetical protein
MNTAHPIDLFTKMEARFAAFFELGMASWDTYCLMQSNPDGMTCDPTIPLPLARGLVEFGHDLEEAREAAEAWYAEEKRGAR